MKDAAIYSLATVFFSQISKLGSIIITNDYLAFNMYLVPAIIIVAFVSASLGVKVSKKFSNEQIERFYYVIMVILCLITLGNIIAYW